MQQEIINYPFDELEENDRSNDDHSAESAYVERTGTPDTAITYVNGHHLPDEDEDDLILGEEDELTEDDFDDEEIDVEVDDDLDEDITEDDLVLDADNDEEDEEDL